MKYSAAVLLLIGASAARHHHHHHHRVPREALGYVQFIPEVHVPVSGSIPGVTLMEQKSFSQSESDPIHGSLGPRKAKRQDLTPEQQFEYDQRRVPEVTFKDEPETVDHTNDSIKAAEAIVGASMADPESDKEKAKIKETPAYHLADSDDEDHDTVETRRSVKTAEKKLRSRFFINARDRRDYDKKVANGEIAEPELNFKEDEDQEIGADPAKDAAKEAGKKAALAAKVEEEKAAAANEDGKSAKELAKEKKDKEKDDAIQAAKADTPENAPGKGVPAGKKEKKDPKKAPAPAPAAVMDFVPPELAGEMEPVAAGAGGDFIPPELMGNMESAGGSAGGDFIPPELAGDMSGGGGGGDFIPPELMGDMSGGGGEGDFIPPELMGDMQAAVQRRSIHMKPRSRPVRLVQNVERFHI